MFFKSLDSYITYSVLSTTIGDQKQASWMTTHRCELLRSFTFKVTFGWNGFEVDQKSIGMSVM